MRSPQEGVGRKMMGDIFNRLVLCLINEQTSKRAILVFIGLLSAVCVAAFSIYSKYISDDRYERLSIANS